MSVRARLLCLGAVAVAPLLTSPMLLPSHRARGQEARLGAPERELAVVVDVDATREAPANPVTRDALLAALAPDATSSGPAGAHPPSRNDVVAWGRLDAPAANVRLTGVPDTGPPTVSAYAVRPREGASVVLVNRGVEPVQIRLRVHLPRGIYSGERLLFSVAPPAEGDRAAGSDAMPVRVPMSPQVDRLIGRDCPDPAVVTTSWRLDGGDACVVQYTDEARRAWSALYACREELHLLAASAPQAGRKLRRIIAEGEEYLGGLSAGRARRFDKRIGCIHRLLLYTSQAMSLSRNYKSRGLPAGGLSDALQHLSDSLSEASATLLGLTPHISVREVTGARAVAAQTQVTLWVTNNGPRSVDLVRLGVDASSLPPGVRCRPSDAAYFGTLEPGQTVTATFRTTGAVTGCAGNISYFAAGSPAFLREKAW